jgi:hypothetical protein
MTRPSIAALLRAKCNPAIYANVFKIFLPKFYIHFLSLPPEPHVPSSSFFVLTRLMYLVRITSPKSTPYAALFNAVLLCEISGLRRSVVGLCDVSACSAAPVSTNVSWQHVCPIWDNLVTCYFSVRNIFFNSLILNSCNLFYTKL